MKYITYINSDNMECFVVFDRLTNHIDIAERIIMFERLGAGSIGFNEDGAHCYGESVTMRLKSRKEDSDLINRLNRIYS